jgi:hypothetical protein
MNTSHGFSQIHTDKITLSKIQSSPALVKKEKPIAYPEPVEKRLSPHGLTRTRAVCILKRFIRVDPRESVARFWIFFTRR